MALLLIPALWAFLALPFAARRRGAAAAPAHVALAAGRIPGATRRSGREAGFVGGLEAMPLRKVAVAGLGGPGEPKRRVTPPRRRRRVLTRLLAAIGVTFLLGLLPPLRPLLVVDLFLVNTFLGYVTLLVHRSNRQPLRATGGSGAAVIDPAPAPAPDPEPAPAPSTPDDVHLRYVPAFDGLRALAVAAVFAYHAGVGWAQGGFLGVDVFFVLSGYLITALLVREWRRDGRIDLARFFRRRARRLLPALVTLVVAVSVAVPLLARDQAYRLRTDVASALAYVGNWRLIFEHQSYFRAMGRPPVLQHLWSLAVEGQFYVVWPLVMILLLRRWDARRLVWPILALAAGSSGLMALLYHPAVDPSRLYYGTDTRAAALLIGAALACRPPRWRLQPGRPRRIALELVSATALVGLAVCVVAVNQFDAGLYRGGFLAVAVLAGVLIAAATHPDGWLGTVLGTRPLVWLGQRSYAVYLWFWPVLMLTRPHSDVPLTGLPLLALRIGITLALAALSYRFVECPLRSGALGRAWAARAAGERRRRPGVGRPATGWALVSALAVLAVGSALVVPYRAQPVANLALPAVGPVAPLAEADAALQTGVAGPEVTTTTAPVGPAAPPDPGSSAVAAAVPAPTLAPRVTAIGESVLLEARASLEHDFDGAVVDAVVGRQFPESLAAARTLRDEGRIGDEVLVQVGSNGVVDPAQFDELLGILGDARVVVVNVKVPRPWEGPNNDTLAAAVRKRPGAVLLDWHALGVAHPEAFGDDGVHLTPAGLRLYLQLLLSKL
ncbi:MAG: acyltransferase [Actinomycetota bacterium]|nr:acyltransferase [Actinomycetota bacterium]